MTATAVVPGRSVSGDDKYLSFNRPDYSSFAENEPGGRKVKFPTAWCLWEKPVGNHSSNDHDHYSSAMRCLCRITNVEEFWRYWLCVPQPGELLEGKHFVRDIGNGELTVIDTLMLFREGVRPEWEDAANASGGHFQFMFKPASVNGSLIDEYWNNLAMGICGGTIEPRDQITGIRLLDKTSAGRNSCIRIEVWFKDYSNQEAVHALRQGVESCMAKRIDGSIGNPPKAEIKSHSS